MNYENQTKLMAILVCFAPAVGYLLFGLLLDSPYVVDLVFTAIVFGCIFCPIVYIFVFNLWKTERWLW